MTKLKKGTKIGLIVAAAVIVVAGVVTLVAWPKGDAQARAQQMMMSMLNTGSGLSELERMDLVNTVSVSGNVRSANVKKVYLEAAGAGKAQAVNVKVGDTVAVGDVLATFDTEDLQKDYDKAKLQADQASERAQISLDGAQNSYSSGKITQDQAVRAAEDNVDVMQEQYDATYDRYIEAVEDFNNGELVATLQTDAAYTMAEYNYKTAKNELHDLLELQAIAQSELDGVVNDPDANETVKEAAETALNMINLQVMQAQQTTEAAKAAMDDARELFESKEVDAESVLDEFKEAVDDAQKALDSAKKRLEETKAQRSYALSSYSQNIENAELGADMTVTEMNLADALENIEKCTVTAPVAGTITAVYATEGEHSASGALLFVIEDLNDLEIKTTVKEYDVAQLEVGMPAVVKSDSTGVTQYAGKVEEIGVTAVKNAYGDTVQSSTAEFDLTISVDPGDGNLRVGMNSRAVITVGGKEDVLAVLYNSVAYEKDGKAYVYAALPNEKGELVATKVYVETGVETDYEIEIITDALQEGDKIVDDPETVQEGQLLGVA